MNWVKPVKWSYWNELEFTSAELDPISSYGVKGRETQQLDRKTGRNRGFIANWTHARSNDGRKENKRWNWRFPASVSRCILSLRIHKYSAMETRGVTFLDGLKVSLQYFPRYVSRAAGVAERERERGTPASVDINIFYWKTFVPVWLHRAIRIRAAISTVPSLQPIALIRSLRTASSKTSISLALNNRTVPYMVGSVRVLRGLWSFDGKLSGGIMQRLREPELQSLESLKRLHILFRRFRVESRIS